MAVSSAASSGVAQRYAAALFELARERDALDAVAADLDRLEGLLAESPDLVRILASPVASRTEQRRAVLAVSERVGLGELVRNTLGVLADHRRLGALARVIAAFRERLAEAKGETTAEIVSAAPLAEEDLASLRAALGRFAGRKVRIATRVDPSLLAGLTVRVGSRMIDASLRRRLQQLETTMKGIG
ncbi:MAG: F0F1 ATP synthase subunit delta [Geminicoccaceae bacterium]|nr:F0F1 ATP synthase subunit delta [Geminicoccaceae bacterium]MCX8099911.1 F0F1 ATP synthase subunit delta [Geminicoccaceae bacterium]MDW8371612.1 F0F1 ATP synthase subunit delta [Geminicoccaceae bacterium]